MQTNSTIIVPIDFLSHTDKVVAYALNMAKKLNATLHFLHVVEEVNIYGDYMGPTIKHFVPQMMELSQEKMDNLVTKNNTSETPCLGKVLNGDVVEGICAYAEKNNADMIIIGTHGRKGLEKMWLGSVAERVVKNAPCPTLTYNPFK
ncbi:universal stress protein [Desulfogranum marinum]|jgi:nucleotide-binding universal stress UspA family protein|uniref:universal stress protein n=1 Tax=Desulfogranum marinum TaxID=453220 RepID=UPI00196462BB|nr:universal stress protein [Desulfogranum marinum]MBM9514341.1 universal stress protein [Desulfogranum marinum]